MNERVMEIVGYIVDSMVSSNDDDNLIHQMQTLSEKLVSKGFTEYEINLAFSWLMESYQPSADNTDVVKNQSPAALSAVPWINIIRSATKSSELDFLYQLKELSIIGDEEIEHILDHSLMQGKQGTSLSEIEVLTSGLIFDPDETANSSFFVINQKYNGH